MENISQKIKSNLGSVVKVITYAIEKDKNALIELLRKNGVEIKNDIDKSKLRAILVSALRESETFRTEFRNWVLERSGANRSKKALNILAKLPKLPKTFNSANGFNPGNFQFEESLFLQSQPSTTTLNQPTLSTDKKESFWNVDLDTILDFAKDGINNYAIIVKSKSEESVMNKALAIEQQKDNSLAPSSSSNSKAKYVYIGVAAVLITGLSIWYFNKKK